MAAGKPIVSTPYAYAVEMLSPDRGVIVPAASPETLAAEFIRLLGDPELRSAIGLRAYERSRSMVWWEVGSRTGTSSTPPSTGAPALPAGRPAN